jgi:iron complex transport system ATP-binding protein
MTKTALIELQHVRVKCGKKEVFSDLSLTLPPDRSSAVIGPNGSGKSTLLKMVFRELYPIADENSSFKVLGQSAWEMDRLRQRMGLVSHELQSKIHKESTVLQVVISQFYSSLTTWSHQTYSSEQIETARSYIEAMGIGHLSRNLFVTLSTGEQRRCLLARALIHDPEYLILDEPTSGLDIKATHQYMETMSTLLASGKKIVLVTHHLQEILPEIDWFVFLKDGQLVDEGERSELLTEKKISDLFEIPIQLREVDGRYLATAS